MAAHHHEHLGILLDDVPQLGALATELDGAGLGVRAILNVVAGDDGGTVGVLLEHLLQPFYLPGGGVPAGLAALTGQGDDHVGVAAGLHEHGAAPGLGGEVGAGEGHVLLAVGAEVVPVAGAVARPVVVVAGLDQELHSGLGQLVEDVLGVVVLGGVAGVVHHVAQVDDALDVQLIHTVNELVHGGVHHVGAVLHGVLGVGDEHEVVVVLVPQRIGLVAAELAHVLLGVGDQPLALVQSVPSDAHLLEVALEELVQAVPPAGADAEAAVGGVGVHAHHVVGHVVPEGLTAVDIGGNLVAVGDDGDVVPHAALVHGHGPGRRGHGVVAVGVAGDELNLLTIGHRGIHGALLPLGVAAAGALAADEAHPAVCGGPVLGELIDKFQGIAVLELLAVDGGPGLGDEVGAGFAGAVAVKDQAAPGSGHGVGGEGQVVLPVALPVGLHHQVVAVAALVLNDQAACGDGALGVLLLEFPVGHHGDVGLGGSLGVDGGHQAQHHGPGQRRSAPAASQGLGFVERHLVSSLFVMRGDTSPISQISSDASTV